MISLITLLATFFNLHAYQSHRPRAAAAAENMWSGRYDENNVKRDIGDAMPRMFDWRYRLLERGIRAEALQPLWW